MRVPSFHPPHALADLESDMALYQTVKDDSASLASVAFDGPGAEIGLRGPHRPYLIRDELLCEIFAATVHADPQSVAMITPAGRLTYVEVEA